MKQMTGKAVSKVFDGKKLDKPVPYTWTYTEFEHFSEIEPLTEEEQLAARNKAEESKKRSAAMTAALLAVGIKKATAEDEQVALREMFRSLCKVLKPGTLERKWTDEQARERAAIAVGADWED